MCMSCDAQLYTLAYSCILSHIFVYYHVYSCILLHTLVYYHIYSCILSYVFVYYCVFLYTMTMILVHSCYYGYILCAFLYTMTVYFVHSCILRLYTLYTMTMIWCILVYYDCILCVVIFATPLQVIVSNRVLNSSRTISNLITTWPLPPTPILNNVTNRTLTFTLPLETRHNVITHIMVLVSQILFKF